MAWKDIPDLLGVRTVTKQSILSWGRVIFLPEGLWDLAWLCYLQRFRVHFLLMSDTINWFPNQ